MMRFISITESKIRIMLRIEKNRVEVDQMIQNKLTEVKRMMLTCNDLTPRIRTYLTNKAFLCAFHNYC